MPFTEFERDATAATGVFFRDFITALATWVYTNEGDYECTVAEAALAFNTTPELVREAIEGHPWLLLRGADETDPTKQVIESDGE